MTDETRTIQHIWFEEVWSNGRVELIDELVDPDIIVHGLVDPNGDQVPGVEAFRSFYKSYRSAFPDIQITVEDTVSEGDKILARCRVKGTHRGEGVVASPTNQPVEFTGMCLIRVKDGKIVESWNSFDLLTMFQQLGLVTIAGK